MCAKFDLDPQLGVGDFYERDPAGTLIAQRGNAGEFYFYLDGPARSSA